MSYYRSIVAGVFACAESLQAGADLAGSTLPNVVLASAFTVFFVALFYIEWPRPRTTTSAFSLDYLPPEG